MEGVPLPPLIYNMISNKNLYTIHSWLGLNLGLFLFVICFSGTIAVFSSDIDWLTNPSIRIEPTDEPVLWGKMYTSILQQFPDGTISSIYKETYAGTGSSFATVAYVSIPNGQIRKVYLNPYTGKIQGNTSFFNVQRFFRTFHRRFFDGNRGIILVTLTSFFLLFSIITGFLFYKGWLKNLFTLRTKNGLKRFISDAHKFAGIWTLLFGLLIAVTGLFYFTEQMISVSNKSEILLPEGPPALTAESIFTSKEALNLANVDTVIENAEEAFPNLEIMTLRVPQEPTDYFYIDGQAGNPFTRNRANKVYLHPITGEVVHIQHASDLNTAEFIADIADPLHFGTVGGITTKTIWFIFGLALCFSILSGIYIWQIRASQKIQRTLKKARRQNSDPPGFWQRLNQQKSVIISVGIVLFYFIYIFTITLSGIRDFSPQNAEQSVSVMTDFSNNSELNIELTKRWIQNRSTEFGEIDVHIISDSLLPIQSVEWVEDTEKASSDVLITGKRRGHPEQHKFAITGLQKNSRGTIHIQFINQPSVSIEDINPEFHSFRASRKLSPATGGFPKAPSGVWITIILFSLCTTGLIITWTYLILKPAFILR